MLDADMIETKSTMIWRLESYVGSIALRQARDLSQAFGALLLRLTDALASDEIIRAVNQSVRAIWGNQLSQSPGLNWAQTGVKRA